MTGYHGDDCSVSMVTVPSVTSLSEELYSVTGDTSVSNTVVVYGNGFVNSATLTCHLATVEVSVECRL